MTTATAFPRPFAPGRFRARRLCALGIVLLLVLWLVPFLGIVLTSVRSIYDITSGNFWGWPRDPQMLANYREVLLGTPLGRYMLNSLLIAGVSTLGVLVLGTLCGFVLARYRFPGATLMFALFVAGNFVPYQVIMIPVRNLMVTLGLYDSMAALILFHLAFQTGFAVLFMRNFIGSLPDELFQAARAEGAGTLQTLRFVVLPLTRPALAALAILLFTFIWNDYFWAIVLTFSDGAKPVTAGLANLKGVFFSNWHLIAAATVVVAVPPVAVFLLLQRHFIGGLTMGAVKG